MTETNLNSGGETTTKNRIQAAVKLTKVPGFKVSGIAIKDSDALLGTDGVAVRTALQDDGALLWELARDAGGIDLNSPYAYMMLCRNFMDTCVVAEVYGQPAGFVTAHRVPSRNHVLFVWQVAVLPEFRGMGIARRLLDALVERPACVGVRKLESTVTPSNAGSTALFAAFAKARGAAMDISPGFTTDDFPEDERHEEERLFTIQPIHPID